MTETEEFVELYITENTLDEILSAMRNPLPIAPDKQPEIIERLRELYLAVHIEHRLAPMNIRNEIVPHFRKRGGIGPDTTAVRRIAEIYEFAFERRFSINPRENCSNRLCYTLRTIVVAMVDVR